MSKKSARPKAPAKSSHSPRPSARRAEIKRRRLRKGATLLEVFTEQDRVERMIATREQKEAIRLERERAAHLARINAQAARYTRATRTLLARIAAYGTAAPVAFIDEWRGSKEIVITAGHVARFAAPSAQRGTLPPLALPCSALPPLF